MKSSLFMLPTVLFFSTPMLMLHHLMISLVPAIIYIGTCCTRRINPSGEPLREGELQCKLWELRAIGHIENMLRTSEVNLSQDRGERNLRSYRFYVEHRNLVLFIFSLVPVFYVGTCITLNTNPYPIQSNTLAPVVMLRHLMISLVPAIIYIGTSCTRRINPSGEPLREGEMQWKLCELRAIDTKGTSEVILQQDRGERNPRSYRSYIEHRNLVLFFISLVPAIYIGTCIKMHLFSTTKINPSGEPLREEELQCKLQEPRCFWRNNKVGLSLKIVGMV